MNFFFFIATILSFIQYTVLNRSILTLTVIHMQRIPNPVSDLNVFLRVFREIYFILQNTNEFGLDDISRAMISTNNVTSQGAIGNEALKRSFRVDRSRDPIYNQSKMYAELFRTLGWILFTSSKLTYTFSLLGIHVATASNPNSLMQECLLGIAYPNEVLGVKSTQNIRVFSSIILTLDSLKWISRDEMIAGPLSISDDQDPNMFKKMIDTIIFCRNNPTELQKIICDLSAQRRISKVTMGNYTRFPIAVFPWAGWGVKKSRGIIEFTEAGEKIALLLKNNPDIRLSDFNNFPDETKPSFIRFTFYSILSRSGFNIDSILKILATDIDILKQYKIPYADYISFSPFQQLSRDTIKKWTPELVIEKESYDNKEFDSSHNITAKISSSNQNYSNIVFNLSDNAVSSTSQLDLLIEEINKALEKSNSEYDAAEILYNTYSSSNKDVFYPLIGNLFCILGFDCRVSRGGQNYARADAIILNPHTSIPIEIKSPGEEPEISIKGIRQALENKIILLSRKNYPTDIETTTLVVGFNPPNNRSEVHDLINDIKNTFNIRIGVIDFLSLLKLTVRSVKNNKQLDSTDFNLLEGIIYVENS